MQELLMNFAMFIKEIGAPTALAFAIWHLANKALQLDTIAQVLIRVDEKLERVLLLLAGSEDNDAS